ncbi:hypothetical protein SAMN05443247_04558 [Bradyrhizobium erythrophlei]|jgi:hypothetical protein|nr:hypothetical protein SAMN05443247_04558 [Bradyrhizobium erythrophlei]
MASNNLKKQNDRIRGPLAKANLARVNCDYRGFEEAIIELRGIHGIGDVDFVKSITQIGLQRLALADGRDFEMSMAACEKEFESDQADPQQTGCSSVPAPTATPTTARSTSRGICRPTLRRSPPATCTSTGSFQTAAGGPRTTGRGGISLDSYIKSFARHWQDLRRLHRGLPPRNGDDLFAAVGATQFNINGYAHEIEKARVEAAGNRDSDTASARTAAQIQPVPII